MNDRVAAAVRSVADQAASVEWLDVPEAVKDRTLMVVFDTLGVMIAGAQTREVQDLASQFSEVGSAPLIGFSRRTSIDAACWVNGFSTCSLELDEGNKYAGGHPAGHTIPAALALGPGHTGTQWLSSVLAGYEVSARFGRATRLGGGVHPHGTWGATGAAAAAARLTNLDVDGIAAAIDAVTGLTLAPNFESAVNGHPVRNLWVGAANVLGVTAAKLAAAGVSEVHGTAAGTYGGLIGEFDETRLTVPFGTRYEIMHGYFKRHASCAYTHAAADAVLKLHADSRIAMNSIESVRVETFAMAAALDSTEWPTRLAAMFSIPYVVAVAIREGAFAPSATGEGFRSDPEIGRVANVVSVVATEEFDGRLPDRRGARVTVALRDGTERSAEVEQPIGDAAHEPFGWTELRSKIVGLIGTDRATLLEQAVRALEDGSFDEFSEALETV
jgi:2-methylcitrate dehydratase PrpD